MAQDDLEDIMGKTVRVEVKPRYHNEPVEKMIKRFTKKTNYEKPSVKRRKKAKKRKKILEKLDRVNRENLDNRRGKNGN